MIFHASPTRGAYPWRIKQDDPIADGLVMAACAHGMDAAWCYLCRVDNEGTDPHVLWGLAFDDDLELLETSPDPMSPEMAGYLRFLCDELAMRYDETFTHGEAAMVIQGLLTDPASDGQRRTLIALGGDGTVEPLSYGEARTKIRRAIALRGLRSA
jgi:hypothetical protein